MRVNFKIKISIAPGTRVYRNEYGLLLIADALHPPRGQTMTPAPANADLDASLTKELPP